MPKKRKFENDTDEEDVKPKIPKTELTGNLHRCVDRKIPLLRPA